MSKFRPPTRLRASSTITERPARRTARAATSPASPAPTTATSYTFRGLPRFAEAGTAVDAAPAAPAARSSRRRMRGVTRRSVVEQPVPVLAALVGELCDCRHPLVVVRLDLVERRLHPAGGPGAERLGDVALLSRRLHALVLEDRGHAREDRDLRVDVGDGVGQPFLDELPLGDRAAVLAQ